MDTTEDGKLIHRNDDGVALCVSPVPFAEPNATNASGEPLALAGMEAHCCENGQIFYAAPCQRLAGDKTLVRMFEEEVPVLDSDGEILGWVRDSGNKAIKAPSGQVPVIDAKGAVERFVSQDAEAPSGTRAERNSDDEVLFFIYEGDCEPLPVAVEAAPAEPTKPVAPVAPAADVGELVAAVEPAAAPAAPVAPGSIKFHKTSKPVGDVGADVWRNSIGMEFRRIPAGTFKMGSPVTEECRESWGSDETQREVTISRDFYMAVFETPQAEWETAMKNNPSVVKCERLPVMRVSFVDALLFVEKLNEKLRDELEANFGEGARYDLPTEAQWEYACRAGTETAYSFGDACDGSQANVNGCRPYGTTEPGVSLERPTDVGTYAPNAWGLYDMHGNVWEWTLDRYAPYDTNDTTDPANLLGRGLYRVLRGGAWGYDAWSARAANRVNDSDIVFAHCPDAVGLRLIIVLGDDEPLLKETVPGNNAMTRQLRERLEKFGGNQ